MVVSLMSQLGGCIFNSKVIGPVQDEKDGVGVPTRKKKITYLYLWH